MSSHLTAQEVHGRQEVVPCARLRAHPADLPARVHQRPQARLAKRPAGTAAGGGEVEEQHLTAGAQLVDPLAVQGRSSLDSSHRLEL